MSAADTQFDKNAKAGDSRNSAVTQNLASGDSVTVTATRETSSFFARIFDHDHTTITVTARATIESYTSYASTGDVMPRLEDVQPNRPVGRERAVHSPTPELAATRRRPDRDQPGRRHDVAERLQPGAGGRFRLLRDHWVRQPVDPRSCKNSDGKYVNGTFVGLVDSATAGSSTGAWDLTFSTASTLQLTG